MALTSTAATLRPMDDDLPLSAKLGYAVGIYGPMLGWVAIGQYLLYFYTDVAGIDPAKAGLIFLCALVWDAITDPIIGVIADRTRTRWGHYRPYLLFSAIPFALAVAFVFFPVGANTPEIFWIALATHLIFRTMYTLVYMPFTAMIARITSSYDSRTSLTGIKTMFVFLGNLTISFGFYRLVEWLGGGDEGTGFFRAASLVGATAAFFIFLCFFTTREPADEPQEEEAHMPSLSAAFPDLMRNRAFLLLFLGVFVFGFAYSMQIAMTAYVAKYWLGDAANTSTLFTTQAIAGLCSLPMWMWLGKRYGKSVVWALAMLLAATALASLYLIKPDQVWQVAAFYSLGNIGGGGFLMVFYAMTADTVDWGERNEGRRHEGVVFGAISFANKLGNGLSKATVGTGLALAGFIANTEASPETIDGIFMLATLLPAACYILVAALMKWYPVTKASHAEAMQELTAKRAARA